MYDDDYTMRFATEEDCQTVLGLIREFSVYIGAPHEVTATLDMLRESLFVKRQAEVLLVVRQDEPIGYALYYPSYSSWAGQACMFMEDLFIREEHRRSGMGGKVLKRLAEICSERRYARMEWHCRDWNKHSIAFYLKNGAERIRGSGLYRLEGSCLAKLAGC